MPGRNIGKLTAVFRSESSALGLIAARALPGTLIMRMKPARGTTCTDDSRSAGIDHSQLCSDRSGIYTDGAEELFSRMRLAEIGHHHHIAGAYLVRYAQGSAWREDYHRVDNGRQVNTMAGLAMKATISVDWCGYWQRAQKAA